MKYRKTHFSLKTSLKTSVINLCVVERKTTYKKSEVMQNRENLKRIKDYRVYINDDLTKLEIKKQQIIRRSQNCV